MFFRGLAAAALVAQAQAAIIDLRQVTSTGTAATTATPDYFQTTPELFPGPTATGSAPFLAETNPAPFPSVSYIPPQPLETQEPISGNTNNANIFQLHGQLSHYFPGPGFGVDEYPLPVGSNITWLNMLSRHGSRYPTSGSGALTLGAKLTSLSRNASIHGTGATSFLNTWTSKIGNDILTPVGNQELFDSGVLHQYRYGHLYPNDGSKIIARTTTQDRMLKSAEYFLSGFFGLQWTRNATLELIIEPGFNNTLAGYYDCPNSNTAVSAGGTNASTEWIGIYLQAATRRIASQISGYNWTIADSYNAQSLCAYETVALGYSAFCDLFTYQEWEGYEYSVDIAFAGQYGFQSPTARATGIGYVEEVLARLQHHYITSATGEVNVTLDSMASTFPLNQSLYFDFSHDTNIMSILTAFGLRQFAPYLPPTYILQNRSLVVSHLEPFGARLDIELIQTPAPVPPTRNCTYEGGYATTYIHFILNQRTLPLHSSFSQCEYRVDGWCELGAFLQAQASSYALSQYTYACFGNYTAVPYGTITDGAPAPGPAVTNSTYTPPSNATA